MAQFTITVPDAKLADFKTGFLKAAPKPDSFGGSENAWIKHAVVNWIKATYRQGKEELAAEAATPTIDNDIAS